MIKILRAALFFCLLYHKSFGQPNTFPGPVGIATNNVQNTLQVGVNPANYSGHDALFSNANGSIGIYSGTGYSYISSSQNLGLQTLGGNLGIGTVYPFEKLHVGGNIFVQSPYLGSGNSSGPMLRLADYWYSPWHAGIGVTQGEGVDVLDLDFYSTYQTPRLNMKLTAHGDLGLGTTNPMNKLQVGPNPAQYSGHDAVFSNGNGSLALYNAPGYSYLLANQVLQLHCDGGYVEIGTTATSDNKLYVFSSGNVGIGTANPGQFKLAVEGKIGTRKLVVTQNPNWADYVFKDDYRLPRLSEVEAYIKEHKHLPDIPSAAEVGRNGLDVGENQAVLLKKVEELTLYVIALNKRMDEQKAINERQQKLIDQQTKLLEQVKQ